MRKLLCPLLALAILLTGAYAPLSAATTSDDGSAGIQVVKKDKKGKKKKGKKKKGKGKKKKAAAASIRNVI